MNHMTPYQERLLGDIRDRLEAAERIIKRESSDIDLHSMRTVSSQISQCGIEIANLIGSMEFQSEMLHTKGKETK
jgi:phosphate-selective porin